MQSAARGPDRPAVPRVALPVELRAARGPGEQRVPDVARDNAHDAHHLHDVQRILDHAGVHPEE